MKISASLFFTDLLPHRKKIFHKLLKNKVFNDHSAEEVFTEFKKAGIEGIELLLPSFTKARDEDIQEVKKILDHNHTPILSVHQVIRLFTKTQIEEVKDTFRIAQMLNAKVIVIHMNSAKGQIFDKNYIAQIHALQEEYGIRVGFENMEKYFVRLHLKHIWHEDHFGALMQKNNLDITLDTTHLAHSGGDIIRFYEKNKDRIVNIHLSDYRPHILNASLRPIRYKHLPLGQGVLPIEKFIKLLKKENYEGLITLEIHTDLAGMCESAQKITAALKGKQ